VSRWRILLAVLILAAGFGASGLIAYSRLHARTGAYEAQIAPIVESYNSIVRRWNAFVDDFNAYTPPADGQPDRFATNSLTLTDGLATDAQLAIARWNAVTPPPRLTESHRLASEAMRVTQSAFLEMSLYLEEIAMHGVAFSDRTEAASLKLAQASELLDRARASAREAAR
jgi:hypothetical protein